MTYVKKNHYYNNQKYDKKIIKDLGIYHNFHQNSHSCNGDDRWCH